MNAEMSDTTAGRPAGWIYFDGECRFCVAHRRRWGPLFERRGFVWIPLQTPGTARQLGLTEARLHEQMWLRLPDGRLYGGVESWAAAMRRVPWLWPLGVALMLPGLHALAAAAYRWIAKRRHCLGGTCSLAAHSVNPPPRRRSRLVAGLLGFDLLLLTLSNPAEAARPIRPEPAAAPGARVDATATHDAAPVHQRFGTP